MVGRPIDCPTSTLKAPIKKQIMVIPIASPVKSSGGCLGLGEVVKINRPTFEVSIIEANVTIEPVNQIIRFRKILISPNIGSRWFGFWFNSCYVCLIIVNESFRIGHDYIKFSR